MQASPPGQLSGCVVIETSISPIVVGLFGHDCPKTCANFLSLCRFGFYNGTYVRRVVRNQFAEVHPHSDVGCWTADGIAQNNPDMKVPLEVSNQIKGPLAPSGQPVPHRRARIDREGLLLALPDSSSAGQTSCSFAFTLATTKPIDYLERKATVFGIVLDGHAVLRKLNASALTAPGPSGGSGAGIADGAPVTLMRLKRTTIVDAGVSGRQLTDFSKSPTMSEFTQRLRMELAIRNPGAPLPPSAIKLFCSTTAPGVQQSQTEHLPPVYDEEEFFGFLPSDAEDERKASEAANGGSGQDVAFQKAQTEAQRARVDRSRTLMLQLLGELPSDAEGGTKPPDNVLFVCKLNPYTTSEDLEAIFANNFGKVRSCEVVKDAKTGRSLQYAFVEFESTEDCQRAYFKMDNVLIDECRIHVDFSQSVAGIWRNSRASGAAAKRGGAVDRPQQPKLSQPGAPAK